MLGKNLGGRVLGEGGGGNPPSDKLSEITTKGRF